MKSQEFINRFVKPIIERVRNHEVETWFHKDDSLIEICKRISTHIKKGYRSDVTPDGFFIRLFQLSSYYAYSEEKETVLNLDYGEFLTRYLESVLATLDIKGEEYAPDMTGDRLFNFKDVASYHHKGNSLDVWFYYVMKHISSLLLFERNRVAESEPIYNRCIDVAAYSILGLALHVEYVREHSGFKGGNDDSNNRETT